MLEVNDIRHMRAETTRLILLDSGARKKWLPCCHQVSMDKQDDKSLDKTQLNVVIVVNLNADVTFVI